MDATILLVEDETTLREMLTYRLRAEGYEVETASSGTIAIERLHTFHPQILLLDLMLPGVDGLEVCRHVRAMPDLRGVVIIMLTARTEERDRILGLELGADDYITKPFSWGELRARIRGQVRRLEEMDRAALSTTLPKLGTITAATLRIDLDGRYVWKHEVPVEMTSRLFDLLVFFVRHPGIVMTRSRLLEHVWGYDYVGDTRTINVHVRWLREKIETDPSDPHLIQTVRGVGYRFMGEVAS